MASAESEKAPMAIIAADQANRASNGVPAGNPLPWYRQPNLRKLYLMNVILFLGSTSLGYDGSLLNALQAMPSWLEYFGHPEKSPWKLGIFGAIAGFGALFVLLFTSYIADGLGRRMGAALGCVIIILGALLQLFPPVSHPDTMYLAGRFVMGMGTNINNACCPLLITEAAHPRHRGRATTIYNTLFYLGAIVAAWSTFGTLRNLSGNIEWRLPTGLQALIPGVQLIFLPLLPESPRWLISRGREAEAHAILTKYHANGDPSDPFVRWEFSEIRETLRLEKSRSSDSNGNSHDRNGWLELVRTPGNRKRTALIICTAIFSQCSGNSLISYYLAPVLRTIGITSPLDQSTINGGLTIWCLLVSLGSAFLVDRFGRRTLFLFASCGMLCSFVVWTACSALYARNSSDSAGSAVLAMIFLFYGTAGAAWPGLTVAYTVEILPFDIRAKGLTLCFFWTSLSSVFNLYVNPVGLDALGWRFYLVYVGFLVVECLVIYFFFVETKGHTLEEVAVLFDGEDSAAARARAVAKHDVAFSSSIRLPSSGSGVSGGSGVEEMELQRVGVGARVGGEERGP